MKRNLADVSCVKHFFPSPSEEAMQMPASFPTHGMDASKSLNRIVHFKNLKHLRRRWDSNCVEIGNNC